MKVGMDNDWQELNKCLIRVCGFHCHGNSSVSKNHFPREGGSTNSLLISILSHLTFSQKDYYRLERVTEKSSCFLNSNELQ